MRRSSSNCCERGAGKLPASTDLAMKLIVGLGNPGKAYSRSRHNIGFMCLDYLSIRCNLPFNKKQSRAQIARGEISGEGVLLVKPQTYVNLSGQAVSSLLSRFKIPPKNMVVVYDDIDLPLGKIRLRPAGGSGGHKGMESIISSLHTEDFPRIRVGIGHPQETGDMVHYVLGDFTPNEEEVIQRAITQVADLIHCLLTERIESAMNRFN